MRTRRQPKVRAASSVYLDPASCDSTISYKVVAGRYLYGSIQLADCSRKIEWYFGGKREVVAGRYLYGSIQLADCSRKIEWYFGGTRDSTKKIDAAIEALQAFRTAFTEALKKKRTPVRRKKVA